MPANPKAEPVEPSPLPVSGNRTSGATAPVPAATAALHATLDQVLGDCPRGHGVMSAFPVPGRAFSLEICPVCRGVWLDKGELEAVTKGDVGHALLKAAGVA